MPRRWPELYHRLVDTEFEGGDPRQTSSLTLFAEDGLFKVCLSEKAEGLVAFCSGDGLFAVLDALEGQLTDGSVDWRKAKPWKRK